MSFPKDFIWGTATASIQVEGAVSEDGRGVSIWDHYTRWMPEQFYEGNNADVACDQYHRYLEDVALMRELAIKAYRFSVGWPRVIPSGTGAVNKKGLDYYDRLVDELLAAGIAPYATLYHWDLPLELYYRGGWLNPDIPKYFEDYTRAVVERLSDRVVNWMTLNEPQCIIGLGMQQGEHAPFLKLPMRDCLRAAHHTLLAHGRAVKLLRSEAKKKPNIGWAPVGVVFIPATDSPADIEAARRMMFSVNERNFWNNTWFSDPVVLGRYPEDGLKLFGAAAPEYTAEEMALISQPMDFYGANIYSAQIIRAGKDGLPEKVPSPVGPPLTMYHWKMTPGCLYWGPRFLYERYKLPVVITENGLAGCDWVARDGKVHDAHRIDFTSRHLAELRRACADGVRVSGYFHWSFLDNFEWAQGYKLRFGLVHVDYATLKRTPKDSAYWYRDVILSNGENL
jgi:beta-glucosidase